MQLLKFFEAWGHADPGDGRGAAQALGVVVQLMTDDWRPSLSELPAEIPVFPLTGALLLPHGKLPLNIFEPRYKALVEDALADGRMFGMVQPDTASPDQDERPGLFGVGCLGRLSSFSETGDGRYLIALTGMVRFRVRAELGGRRGYRRVAADYSSGSGRIWSHRRNTSRSGTICWWRYVPILPPMGSTRTGPQSRAWATTNWW